MKVSAAGLVCVLAMLVAPLAAQQHFPTNDELRNIRVISNPEISPDLKHVIALVQDSTAQGGKTHLWMLNVDGSAPRQIFRFPPAKVRRPRMLVLGKPGAAAVLESARRSICPMAVRCFLLRTAARSRSCFVCRWMEARPRRSSWSTRLRAAARQLWWM